MKDENDNDNSIDVTKCGIEDAPNGPPEDKRFRTMKLMKDDIKGLYKPPQTLWDESFIGEAIADECHPPNSSFIIGAAGGITTGLLTGFFSANRVPLPINTPIPWNLLPRAQVLLRNSIIGSSVVWRIAKRTVLGTILFAVLECDFKDFVKKPSEKWKGSLAAGAVCGGIFGLRGGFPGMLAGTLLFTAIPGGWELYNRKEQLRSRFFNPN